MEYKIENLGNGISLCVTKEHTFGTDALLLSDFAAPKRTETACDLCAGCGIVPLLWFREQPPRHAYALEIQTEAVALMEQSAALSGLTAFTPLLGDLREANVHIAPSSLDLITCNPPYRAEGTGVPSARPHARTARHETRCTLDDVFAAAKRLLRFGGRICVCQLPERLSDVITAMRVHRIEPKRLRLCQARPGKPPWLVLIEGKLGANPGGLTVEPTFLLEENGRPTPQAQALYRLYRNRK
jgi:tRNA1(Val) A37 N6-methylase TrmN6